jgi:hypothetical protein
MKRSVKIEFLKKKSDIKSAQFPPIGKMGDIRYLFGSKEWIKSFSSTFQVNKPIIIKIVGNRLANSQYIGFQTSADEANILEPIGTPYNDYNFLSLPDQSNKELIFSGLEELQSEGYKINIDLLFNKNEVSSLDEFSKSKEGKFKVKESQMPSVYCEYIEKDNDNKVDKKFSKKLLDRIKRQLVREKLTIKIINGSNLDFKRSLKRLLYHRKDNFFSQNKEDSISAFSTKFDRFVTALTNVKSIKPRCCIYELYLNKKYAASDLYFYENSYFLAYLGSFNRKLSKLSPGMVLTYLIHRDLSEKHKNVIIDYTRGDEPYKFRIGGKNLILYRLYS